MRVSAVTKIRFVIVATMIPAIWFPFTVSAQSHVLINEFDLDPSGDDLQAGNEWSELYNPTSAAVDIGGWKLVTTHGVTKIVTIPGGTSISAYGYYVVTHTSQWLDNDDESIVLLDLADNEVDRTPTKTDNSNNENTWSRFPNGKDTDSDSDWIFQSSTKENSNSGEIPSPPPTLPPQTNDQALPLYPTPLILVLPFMVIPIAMGSILGATRKPQVIQYGGYYYCQRHQAPLYYVPEYAMFYCAVCDSYFQST